MEENKNLNSNEENENTLLETTHTFISDEENENVLLETVQALLSEKKFSLLREMLDAFVINS